MNRISYIAIMALLFFSGCEKSTSEEPANKDDNNIGLDCATCPSLMYTAETVEPGTTTSTCDYFDAPPWPADGTFSGEELIGYTQEGTQAVTVLGDGTCSFGIEAGMYLNGFTQFDFDGSNQTARFLIYGFEANFSLMGLYVNEIAYHNLAETFPLIADGVTVEIDHSPDDIGGWSYFYLIFTGEITNISINGFESGITELCVTKSTEADIPIIDKTQAIYFDDFYDHTGTVVGSYPNYNTPLGYYGFQGTNLSVNFDEFLGYSPTRLSFVHSYFTGSSNLINVQLPNTPLITTIPDSLHFYLAPFGYQVDYYEDLDGLQWNNTTDPPLPGAHVDSIVISGTKMNQVTLGAHLQESELRSICTYYEQ